MAAASGAVQIVVVEETEERCEVTGTREESHFRLMDWFEDWRDANLRSC